MISPWKRAGAGAMLAAASAVLVPACAENESTLFIRACVVPNDACVAEAGEGAVTQSRGLLDVKFNTAGYRCQLLIGNQLVPVGDEARLRTETSRVVVYAFDVTVKDAANQSTLTSYSVPADGLIDPAPGAQPGYGVVQALLLDIQTANSVAGASSGGSFLPEVIVSVVARGRTLGGTELSSGAWEFPITVCNGCTCPGTSPLCTSGAPEGQGLKTDCLFGRDGHCRFMETDCP